MEYFDRVCAHAVSMHYVNAGVLVFQRSNKQGDVLSYRATNVGASLLLPHLSKRVVRLSLMNLKTIYATAKGALEKDVRFVYYG